MSNKEKYKKYIDQIYANGRVTNNGPMVKLLEKRLAEYLGVKNIVLVSNGTVALEIAYRTLGIEGDVITTPFSFVATTSSLVTNGLNPIFADIDSNTLNMDPRNIEKLMESENPNIVVITSPKETHFFYIKKLFVLTNFPTLDRKFPKNFKFLPILAHFQIKNAIKSCQNRSFH